MSAIRRTASPVPTTNATIVAGLVLAVLAWVLVVFMSDPSHGFFASAQDARSYYGLDLEDPYAGRSSWGTVSAFPYSPAFAQLVWPLGLLPWSMFVAAWTAILLACVAWLTGRELLLGGVVVAAAEIMGGNISLLLAVAIVLGFRWPATWSFVLLTKITPGIGLLWFLVRREWRALAIALCATAAIVAVSFALTPSPWPTWIEVLRDNAGRSGTWAAVPVPITVRLPLGMALVIWGARHEQRWTVPVAAMMALPALWYGSLAMLLAVIPLTTRQDREQALAVLSGIFVRLGGGLRQAGGRPHAPGLPTHRPRRSPKSRPSPVTSEDPASRGSVRRDALDKSRTRLSAGYCDRSESRVVWSNGFLPCLSVAIQPSRCLPSGSYLPFCLDQSTKAWKSSMAPLVLPASARARPRLSRSLASRSGGARATACSQAGMT